jgi:hypothetical protein
VKASRWFYAVLTACAVALAGAAWYAALNGRYVFDASGARILDTHTGTWCVPKFLTDSSTTANIRPNPLDDLLGIPSGESPAQHPARDTVHAAAKTALGRALNRVRGADTVSPAHWSALCFKAHEGQR